MQDRKEAFRKPRDNRFKFPWAPMIVFHSAAFVVLAAFLLPSTALPAQSSARTFKLSGRVVRSSGRNPVYVALWQADGFLTRPVQQVRIDPGSEPVFHFEVLKGHWALSAFEDRNHNGSLDMGFFGPKEPSGFWREFRGHHKPRFEEVESFVDRDTSGADIALK